MLDDGDIEKDADYDVEECDEKGDTVAVERCGR